MPGPEERGPEVALNAVQEWSAGATPALLRLAHQLTGDPDVAVCVVVEALARLSSHRHVSPEVGLDDLVTRELLRSLPRRSPTPTTPSSLDRLAPRSRLVSVLAFGAGWDAAGIADATGMSQGRVRSSVGAALAVSPQETWERLLADRRWSVVAPPTLVDDVDRVARGRDRDRRVRVLGAAAVVLALAGSAVVAARIATRPDPLPRTAHEPGLLSWPARGDLVRDGQLLRQSTALWRGTRDGPRGRVYVLWAGRVGVGRLVVLQGYDGRGRPAIAVEGDHDVTFAHARLRLDLVAPLLDRDPPVLVIPYDGNLNVAGLQSGPSQQVVQLLVRPDVDQVEERTSTSAAVPPVLRVSFRQQALTQGLSAPWLVLRGDQPSAAVRVLSRGRAVFTGQLGTFGQAVPTAVHPTVVDPVAAWSGLPRALAAPTLTDDALWWAQVCHVADPTVSLVWVSPGSPAARLEFVTCPGGDVRAQLLVDRPGGTTWADSIAVRRQAGIVEGLAPPIVGAQHTGGGFVVVVGDIRVASMVIGGRVVSGRWGVFQVGDVTNVQVHDARGRQLPL